MADLLQNAQRYRQQHLTLRVALLSQIRLDHPSGAVEWFGLRLHAYPQIHIQQTHPMTCAQ